MSDHQGISHGKRRAKHKLSTYLLIVCLLGAGILSPLSTAVAVGPAPGTAAATAASGLLPGLAGSSTPRRHLGAPDIAADVVGSSPQFAPARRVVGRTAFSRTEENPDGTYTTTYSVRPMHWEDTVAGQWREFDNSIKPAPAGSEYVHENAAANFRANFDRAADVSAGRPVMRFATEGASVRMIALGANPSGSTVSGGRITYANAYQDTDLRYTVDNERVKEDLLLRAAPANAAAASFAFELQLDGATAAKQADGTILFKDPAGELLFTMPRPFMSDSGADPSGAGYSEAVGVTLTELAAGKYRLELAADLGWLRDPERVYPVTLDPTFDTFSGAFQPGTTPGTEGQDTFLYQADSGTTTTRGAAATLDVTTGGTIVRRDTLIQFPEVTKLPRETAVTSSTLKLYAYSGPAGAAVEMRRNTRAWDESTATWDGMPIGTTTTTAVWDTASTVVPGWNTLDTSQLARQWVRGEYDNNGVRLYGTDASNSTVRFYSSEYTSASLRPQLAITYARASRYGVSDLWNYTSQEHGGGNTSHVNTSNGNLVLTHQGGSIGARGFSVDLAHTYNSQDPHYKGSPFTGADYGEGWSFSQDTRLYERDVTNENGANQTGKAVILRDGSGGANRVYILNKDDTTTGKRSYISPLYYKAKLTKYLSPSNPDRTWKLKVDKSGAILYFDGQGKLTRREDRRCDDPDDASDPVDAANCNYLNYAYTTGGQLDTITDVAGRVTNLDYNASGRLSKITDMAGRVSTYEYDTTPNKVGNLIAIHHGVDAAGVAFQTTRFGYDDANQLVSVTNPNNDTSYLRYTVHESWEVAAQGANGWAGSANTTASRSVQRWHDGSGQPQGTGSLQLDFAQVDVNSPGLVSKVYSPKLTLNVVPQELVLWAFKADSSSEPVYARVEVTHNYGETTIGLEKQLTSQEWTAIRMPNVQVDPAWQIQKISVSIYPKTTNPYNGQVYLDHVFAKGVTEALTDAKPAANTLVRLGYDWDLRRTELTRTDTAGNDSTVGFYHDTIGKVVKTIDPAGSETTATYDRFMRLTSVKLPGETSGSSYSYHTDSGSQQTNLIETGATPLGETAKQGVDTNTASTNYGDSTYSVDPFNNYQNSTSSTSTSFEAGVYTRNGDGEVTSAETKTYTKNTDLDVAANRSGGTLKSRTKYEYWPGGLIKHMVPPKCEALVDTSEPACRTEYTYQSTKTGYMTQISAPAGTGETSRRVTNSTPNADGTVASSTDARGNKTVYTYDRIGRLTGISYGMQDNVADHAVTYTLDKNGAMTGMVDRLGTSTWVYDENGQPTSESRTQGGATKTARYAYHANGLLLTMETLESTTASPKVVTYEYDHSLRLKSQTDPNDTAGPSNKVTYTYDQRSRVTSTMFGSTVNQQVGYDKAGRIAKLELFSSNGTNPNLLQSFAYDYGFATAADGSVSTGSGYRGGNVVKVTETTAGLLDSTVTYGYDWASRLTSATRTGTNPYTQSYAYDLNDNRTSITKQGTTTTAAYDDANQMTSFGGASYSYDRGGNLTGYSGNTLSYDAANTWTGGTVNGNTVAFGYDGLGRRVSRSIAGAGTQYWYDNTGMGLETGASSATYLRSPEGRLLSIKSAAGFANYASDRQGTVTATTNQSGGLVNTYRYDPWGSSVGTTGTAYNEYRYAGTYREPDLGLYQMGARFYMPTTGRFTQQDPLDGWSYHYANNNPVNATDPSGLIACYLDLDCTSATFGDLLDQASDAFGGDYWGGGGSGGFGGGSGGGGADFGGGNLVTFSQQSGIHHGYRHVADAGLSGVLSQSAIASAITADLQSVTLGAGQPYESTVDLGAYSIYYRAYGTGPGRINVGTYWPL